MYQQVVSFLTRKVLRTAYSDDADGLWQAALEKLQRWVTDYFIHENRLITNKPDASVNEELARRFVLEVVEDKKTLNFPNLSEVSQEDIGSLTRAFETWRHKALGDVEFDLRDSPRFCDFLVIDEGALRSIAGLPNETPSLDLVSRAERRVCHLSCLLWPTTNSTKRRGIRFSSLPMSGW